MRPSPAICHIGEVRAVVLAGGIAQARHLLPVGRIDCGKRRVALGPGMNFGDFETVGDTHPLLVDFGAADHGNVRGETPQRIAQSNGAGRGE